MLGGMTELSPIRFLCPPKTHEQLLACFRIQEAFRRPRTWFPPPDSSELQEDLPLDE